MEILNAKEAADFLRCTQKTLYAWTSGRKIPHFNTGKKILFSREELERWIQSKRVKTNDELQAEAGKRLRGAR